VDDGTVPVRGATLRVFASAQHPIALGAMLVMLVPLGAVVGLVTRNKRWWFACAVLLLGALATVSRTSIVMLVVAALTFAWTRPGVLRRLWPLVIPLLIVAHLAMPGSIGSLAGAFFPSGGLVAQQAGGAGTRGSGRVADIGPSLTELKPRPIFGEGFGTRVVNGPDQNALILDDQWLTSLLEVGVVGVLALGWLFIHSIRRFGRAAKRDSGPRGWYLAAIASSLSAYVVGMFTYDAFSFVQVTFVFFILIALGVVLLRSPSTAGQSVSRP
jgi:hypothetical protein